MELREKLEARLSTPDLEILKLPATMFEPHRLLIMKSLYLHGHSEFRHLKHGLGLSDGNLFSHLRALEHEKYVNVKKEIVDRKLRTTYELTDTGKTELRKFANAIGLLARLDEFQ